MPSLSASFCKHAAKKHFRDGVSLEDPVRGKFVAVSRPLRRAGDSQHRGGERPEPKIVMRNGAIPHQYDSRDQTGGRVCASCLVVVLKNRLLKKWLFSQPKFARVLMNLSGISDCMTEVLALTAVTPVLWSGHEFPEVDGDVAEKSCPKFQTRSDIEESEPLT